MARTSPPSYYVTRAPTVLEDFSVIGNWTANTITLAADTTKFKEGVQAMKASGTFTSQRIERINLSPTWDFSQGGVIKIRVYCENLPSNATFRIRLSRIAGGVAGDSITIFWNRLSMEDGWNELVMHTAEDGTTHIQGIAWATSGTTVDFSVAMQSISLDLVGTNDSSVFYIDSIEFLPRTRVKVMLGFDSAGADLITWAEPYLTARNMAAYVAVEGSLSAGGFTGSALTRLQTFYDAGWDVIGHTENHTSLDTLGSVQAVIDECQPNLDAILANGFTRGAYHFAYPNSAVDAQAVTALKQMGYKTARTGGNYHIALSQYGFLTSHWFGSMGTANITLAPVLKAVDAAVFYGTCLHIYGHQLVDGPPGASIEWDRNDFESLVDYLVLKRNQGLLDVVTPSQFWDGMTQARI